MRPALEAALASARALVASLEATLAQPEPSDELLDLKQIATEFGAGRDAILAATSRGELQPVRGPRRRLLVSRAELAAWIRSRKVQPKRPAEVVDLGSWEARAERELSRASGGAR